MDENTPSGMAAGSPCGHCYCLEPRLVALAAKVDHIDDRLRETKQQVDHIDNRLKETKQTVEQLRADNRELLRWGMAATALLFGAIISSYLLVTNKTDLITAEAAKSAVAVQKIADEVAAIRAISLEQQSHRAPRP